MRYFRRGTSIKEEFYIDRLDFNGFYTEKLEAISAERAMMDASSTHSSDTGKKMAKRMEAIFMLTMKAIMNSTH